MMSGRQRALLLQTHLVQLQQMRLKLACSGQSLAEAIFLGYSNYCFFPAEITVRILRLLVAWFYELLIIRLLTFRGGLRAVFCEFVQTHILRPPGNGALQEHGYCRYQSQIENDSI